MTSSNPDKSLLPYKMSTTRNINKNPHPLQNCSRETPASLAGRGDRTPTHRPKCITKSLREKAVTTTIGPIGPPPIVIESEIATGTGTGTGIVIVTEGGIHLVVANATTDLTPKMTIDIPLPRAATSEDQTDTDPVDIAKAHTNENAPRDTEMTSIATDLLVGSDRPATSMITMKVQKSTGGVDTRSGSARRKRKGLTIGRTVTFQRDRRAVTTRG